MDRSGQMVTTDHGGYLPGLTRCHGFRLRHGAGEIRDDASALAAFGANPNATNECLQMEFGLARVHRCKISPDTANAVTGPFCVGPIRVEQAELDPIFHGRTQKNQTIRSYSQAPVAD